MKNCILLILLCVSANQIFSQTINGITNQQDTSYTIHSAYTSTKKKYPDIKIVQPMHYAAVKEKYNIVYCNRYQKKLLLDAFAPDTLSKQKRIAIIIVFGGGWRSGNRTMHYPLAQKLASLGYVCFTPDYRLSTEAYFPAAVYDLKAAVRWVKKNALTYNIDTSKISILGFSAGGELAAFVGNTNGNKNFEGTVCNKKYASDVHAIIDIDGTLSFINAESGEGDDGKKTSAATYWLGYPKNANPELWKQASPLTYAGSHTPPTLFINSSLERMHAGRTDYISILNENHIYTEVKNFENSPHAFCLFDPWFQPTVKCIDEFLQKIFK